jgi:GDP-mannose transporter
MAPLFVSVLEYLFLGRQLPTMRSTIALLMIVMGSIAYVGTDNAFGTQGLGAYTWAIVYLTTLCIQMTYGKQIMKSVKMETLWGPVIYSNTLGILPSFALGASLGA